MNRRIDHLPKSSTAKNIKSGINEVVKRRSASTTREVLTSIKPTPSGIIVLDDDTTTVEVTVKKKAKRASSKFSVDNKTPERKSPSESPKIDNIFQHHDWSRILRDQNMPTLKQVFQHAKTPQDQKLIQRRSLENINDNEMRQSNEMRRKSGKYINNDELSMDEMISKQPSSGRKSRERSCQSNGIYSTRSLVSSASVIVYDKGVQCGGIFDGTNENFRRLNPVRALGFLMKELEHAIEGEKASKILTEMEQALLRIPIEAGQLSHADMETVAAKARLEASTAKLEATCKTMEESYKSVRKENTALQQRIQELSLFLKRTKTRESQLDGELEQLKTELNEALKTDLVNKKLINDLEEENRQINLLKQELTEGIEETQHLRLEKEKLTLMSSYKDEEFKKLREAIKELQNNVANQLQGFINFPKKNDVISNPNHHSTMLPTTIKPIPQNAKINEGASAHLLWRNAPELSMVATHPFKNTGQLKPVRNTNHPQIHLLGNHDVTNNTKFAEKTHLDFVSLADHDSSQSSTLSEHQNDDMKSADEVDTSKNNNLSRDDHPRKKRILPRSRKSNDNKSRLSDSKILPPSDNSGYHESVVSSVNMIDKNAKADIQMMFDNVRQKSKYNVPMNVPSPPRNFPHPNWSDSTLQTMSITESNSG